MPGRSAKTLNVIVVADNRETLDGLHGYLSGAGIASQTRRTLGALPTSTTVVVLFPDEFDAEAVTSAIGSLRSSRPKLQLVVITSTPQRYRPTLDPDGRSRLPVVLQKPAFGWTILDTLRGQAGAETQ